MIHPLWAFAPKWCVRLYLKLYDFLMRVAKFFLLAALFAGCGVPTAETRFSYTTKDKAVSWESNKNFDVEYDPETGKFSLKSITPESAIAAQAAQGIKAWSVLEQLLPYLLKAAPPPGI